MGAWLLLPPSTRALAGPLSASAIEMYETCPLKFKIHKDWNIPGDISAALNFGNQPVAKELSDIQAELLAVTFVDGNISIGGGYEADVTPLPSGNGAVTITDWVKVGRYSAGLDTIPSASQFQKADCAPRSSLGNGAITVSDWVQAGRYAAGLDPLASAGGPTGPSGAPTYSGNLVRSGSVPKDGSGGKSGDDREVRVRNSDGMPGQTNTVAVLLNAAGDENALGFTLLFDQSMLTYVSASLGTGGAGGTLSRGPSFPCR